MIQPLTNKFRVDYDSKGVIAAGLSMKLIVTFECQELHNFVDSMVIKYEKDGDKTQ